MLFRHWTTISRLRMDWIVSVLSVGHRLVGAIASRSVGGATVVVNEAQSNFIETRLIVKALQCRLR